MVNAALPSAKAVTENKACFEQFAGLHYA